ncbi:hypothetical protein Hte_002579 [Hypoxylon texense]
MPDNQPLDVCLQAYDHWYRMEPPIARIAVTFPTWTSGDRTYARYIEAHRFSSYDKGYTRPLDPSRVRYNFFKDKLRECLDGHSECQSTRIEVRELHVIDVKTNEVHPAPPGCEYTALSYVWGDDSTCQSPQEGFSPVVQDAVTVTKALGYQYLWVDRYCIDQKSSHKTSMIQQMDRVYANACVTIIAASGSSTSDGLPGISGLPRYQGRVVIGETRLIEVSDVGPETVKLSKWATRGWTYQEGYLSKRRLIFTDNEVLFLCNTKFAKETQTQTTDDANPHEVIKLGYRPQTRRQDRIMNSFRWMIPPAPAAHLDPPRSLYQFIRRHIEEYSERHLSESDDSLNAFLGILKYYELNAVDANGPMSHLWGIPLKLYGNPDEGKVHFDLLWRHRSPARRRNGLPSWSWSGWGGPVQFYDVHPLEFQSPPAEDHEQGKWTNRGDRAIERAVQIHVPRGNGTIDLYSLAGERQSDTLHDVDPKELYITSFVIPLRFLDINSYPKNQSDQWQSASGWGPLPLFAVGPKLSISSPICFDRNHKAESYEWGLVLPVHGKFYLEWNTYNIIVLHPVADGKYERAGIVSLFYDAADGYLTSSESPVDWLICLDEQNCVIEIGEENYSRYGPSKEYFLLKDSKWETVCLV